MGIVRSDNQGGYNPVTSGVSHGACVVVNKDIVVSSVWMSTAVSTSGATMLYPRIYDQNGTLVASGSGVNFAASTAAGWKELPMTPATLVAGKKYIITFYVTSGYSVYANMCGISGVWNGDTDAVVATEQNGYPLSASGDKMPAQQEITNCPPWAVGVSYQLANRAPNPPTHVNISSNGGTYNQFPKLFFSVSDPDSGNTIVGMQVQVAKDSAFTQIMWDAGNTGDAGYGMGYGGNDTGGSLGGWGGFPTSSNASSIVTLRITQPSGWTNLPPANYYLRARVKDNNGAWSSWSATQQFTVKAVPWTDTVTAGTYGFKGQWLSDIFNCIKDIRAFRGWGIAQPPMDGTLDNAKDVKVIHLIERRRYLADAMKYFSATQPTWTNADFTNLLTAQQMNGGTELNNTQNFSYYTAQGPTLGTLAWDPTDSSGWAGCVKLTSNYAGTQHICIYMDTLPAPAKANTKYTVGLWVKGTAGRIARLFAWYRDPTNARFSTSGDAPGFVSYTGQWQFVTLQFTTPANTAYIDLELAIPSAQNGDVVKWGGGFLVEGDPYALNRNTQHIIELRNYITQA